MLEYLESCRSLHREWPIGRYWCKQVMLDHDYNVHLDGQFLRTYQEDNAQDVSVLNGAVALQSLGDNAFAILYTDGTQEIWFSGESKGIITDSLNLPDYIC